ncbi:MAG TPA: FkbM family methyltransferase [Fluviicola sp.]|nr:FkbM family methyltransferase [Fluviicola sp.]
MKIKTKILNLIRTFFKISFLEKFIRNRVKGKSTDSFWAKWVPNNYQYPPNSMRTFAYKGVNLQLDIHDYVSHYLYFQFLDQSHLKLMSLVKKDAVVLDIGTNYGTTILQFAQLVGEAGLCFGFEPDPINFKICQENLRLNHFKNIQVENCGLGHVAGTFELVVDTASNRGGNRIGIDSVGKETHQVSVVPLDDWIKDKNLTKVDLIKIDVEGYEMNVLKGAKEMLQKFKPMLFIELDDSNLKLQGSSSKELVSFLTFLGYGIQHAENKQVILETDPFEGTHFDVVCKVG